MKSVDQEKLYPRRTVHAPFDTYGSKKFEKRRINVSIPDLFLFSLGVFLTKGFIFICIFHKNEFWFALLTYKKEFTEHLFIDVLFHRDPNRDVIFLFLNGPLHLFQVYALLRVKIRPNSICTYRTNDPSTTYFFLTTFLCLPPTKYSMYSSHLYLLVV